MNYDVLYSKNKKQFNKPVRIGNIPNMGNWRSRWERKRDLDKSNGFYINKIYTKPTDKDYIFTKAFGYNNNNKMFFKIVPSTDIPKPKNKDWLNPKYKCRDSNSTKCGKYCKHKKVGK